MRSTLATSLRACAFALGVASTAGCLSFHTGPMPGEPKDAHFVQVQGTRVRVVDKGSGPAVTLVHGFASSLETWRDVIPRLAKHHRVVALDLKGFGWTDRPEGDYSPAAQAALVRGVLDALGVERTALVAHSWGSSVALAFALASPARVERLALYDAWVYEEQLPSMFVWARAGGVGEALFGAFYDERPDERMALAFFDPTKLDEDFAEAIDRAMERPGTKAAALAAARGQRFAEVEGEYRKIGAPTLLLWGREDKVARLGAGERLARELPHARLVVYPRCGHFPMIEALEASTADLDRFLDEAAARPASPPAPPASSPPAPAPAPAPAPGAPARGDAAP